MTKTYTVEISDHNEKVLLNDLLDVNDWIQKAVIGKINNCSKRMANEATTILKADPSVENMPATDEGLQKALLSRDDYKNRAERDASETDA